MISEFFQTKSYGSLRELPVPCKNTCIPSVASAYRESRPGLFLGAHLVPCLSNRGITTMDDSHKSDPQDASAPATEVSPRIKFKRLDKTARHIMQVRNSVVLYSHLSFFFLLSLFKKCNSFADT